MVSGTPENVRRLVELIHASPKVSVIAVAGAGGQALAWLLGVPGASRTVMEAIVPYGQRSMDEYLGHQPAQYVGPEVAREMAQAAYKRALRLREEREPAIGLGCTASIATDRPKRGAHRCCVAAWGSSGVTTYDLKLAKGQRDRTAEEEVVSRIVLHALGEACLHGTELPLGVLDAERLDVRRIEHEDPVRRLLGSGDESSVGGVRTLTVYPDGEMSPDEPIRAAILPGSFSPLHPGHQRLAEVASEVLDAQVVFEISVVNVDKPPLEEHEVRSRLRQFQGRWRVVLTRAPTFHEKAALFPGCTFVIGWDTAVRLVHPSYYGGQEGAMAAALADIRGEGCRFLVAGRVQGDDFRALADVPIPPEFTDLFESIPEYRFRADVSSTKLRGDMRSH